MERKQAAQLIQEQMKILFAFAFSKVRNKEEAEDLCSEIIVQVLNSIKNLKNEEAFYGYMWAIARNVYKNYLRKQKKHESVQLELEYVGCSYMTPERSYESKEDIQILRRELSLLSEQYRQATVSYYIYGKSCMEIADEMQISIDMVKYYLFKVRKILREGIGMNRELGEKSYNPGVFRMDFWGSQSANVWWELFERKLPGNILLSAYYNPVTIRELSIELGVATPYLEDEIHTLIEYGMLSVLSNGRYQTNMIIFTDAYEKEVDQKVRGIYETLAERVNGEIQRIKGLECAKEIRQQVASDQRVLWAITNILAHKVMDELGNIREEQFGEYPILTNGHSGFIYGYDNDYKNHHFNGIYGHVENLESTGYVTVINYKAIEKCQRFNPKLRDECTLLASIAVGEEVMQYTNSCINLIEDNIILNKDGELKPNFPILTQDMLEGLGNELNQIIEDIKTSTLAIIEEASKILKNHAPKNLKDQYGPLVFIKYKLDVMACIVEEMVRKQYLQVPEEKVPLAILGIRK